ncbi:MULTISPECIES: thioredoxin domain-containing protein [unclassified Streptomyces]|uniref:thioredoxin domain-containing protein n=1 Tax=unclassified Streptomyces TaxID=2593676 RepID=UPI003806FF0C
MSSRNSQANKAAARDRLRAERERQAKKDKARRQIIVAASIVGVLAIAGGASYLVMQNMKPTAWEAAKDKTLVKPANTTGTDGTTVVIGKADAKKTLEMYEDPRCPICSQFEQTVGPSIRKDVDAGKYKMQFIGATFIDNGSPGVGSKTALSALGAALNVSPQAFLDYKSALYSAKYHPDETQDKFKDRNYLITIADTVPALKGNAAFDKDVKDGTYDKWALTMSDKFNKSGVTGTPTLKMDGKKITDGASDNAPMDPASYAAAIDKALKG